MNKDGIIELVAYNAGLTKKDASIAVDVVFQAILEALEDGEKVKIAGFGMFQLRDHKARIGVNPVTKGPIEIPAMKAIAFRAGKAAKERVNS